MPSRKPSPPGSPSSAPATERMSHEEARSILGNEMEKAKRLREVEALSVAMTALEAIGD